MSLLERWGLRHVESVDDYLSVLIPLDKAHLYSHSAKQGRAGSASRRDDAEVGDADEEKDGENETSGMLHGHAGEYSIEGLRKEMRQGNQGKWTSNEIKSKLINKALQDIGMGTYNWQLFALCGFGWFADNLWLQGASLTLPSLSAEFGVSEKTVRYTTSALFVGLAIGSFSWGIGSDYVGRRVPFNVTLLIASVFGIATAYQQSWGGVCFFYAAMGFGVGGSLPVDGALFLEFLPDASSALLTVLSVWWPIGQLVSSLIAWFFIAQWPAEQGWRYFLVTIGIMTFTMFAIRFFVFRLLESPKYLLSKGRQHEAVAVIHGVAYRNKTRTWLTSEIMDEVAAEDDGTMGYEEQEYKNSSSGNPLVQKIKGLYSSDKLKLLFKDKKLGLATGLMWFCWTAIGMGYPLFNAFLPQYFARYSGKGEGASVHSETSPITGETYRNYAITSVFGVPGSLIAAYLVDHPSPFFGRRGTLASSTLISAVFLFFFVIWGNTSTKQLIFSCVGSFSQNIMYGVLYAFTPEIFPTPVRGAGSGVASFLNRVAGLFAPVIAANAPGDGADMPIYLSAILILMAFVSICCIPIETRGAQRL